MPNVKKRPEFGRYAGFGSFVIATLIAYWKYPWPNWDACCCA